MPHRLDAAHATLRVDIGVAADRDRAMGAAGVDCRTRARNHLFFCNRGRQCAICGGGAFQCTGRIVEQSAGPRLVEMLVHVDKARQHQLSAKREDLGAIVGQRRADLGNAPIAADPDVERLERRRPEAQDAAPTKYQGTAHVRSFPSLRVGTIPPHKKPRAI